MRPSKLLRIARWEVTKGVGGIDRGAVAVVAAATVFVLAVGLVAVAGGVALEDGIYRVGVAEDSDFHEPVAADPSFAVVEPSPGATEGGRLVDDRYDLLLEARGSQTRIYVAEEGGEPTEKGLAALAALRRSVDRYNDRQMLAEPNETAAFPVIVSIRFVDRGTADRVRPTDGSGGEGSGAGGGGGTGGGGTEQTDTGDDGGNGDPADSESDDEGGIGAPSLGSFDLFGTAQTSGSPSEIQPPFPFQSLVLAFTFVLPLNFLIQAYGSSMLSERLNRRGELLLVAPVSRSEIVFGKTLPYFAAGLGVTAAIVGGLWLLGTDAGLLSVVAVVPLALLFLATTFLGAMFARSFKELTFVTVTVSTVLTTFAFVPAIFAETSRVAFVSPLTLAIRDLTGSGVSPGEFLFATGPSTLVAGICFLFGLGVYREEDLFTQRPIHLKLLDSLAGRIQRARGVAVVVALLVPFVFVAELLAVAVLFALPVAVSIPLVFASIAVIEELAKGLPIYAGYVNARFEATLATTVSVGIAAGGGFFLAEKLTLAVQFVGLPQLQVADAAFQTGLGTGNPAVILLLALAPLVLHTVTSVLSALGASRGRTPFLVGLTGAVLVHLAYNVAVVSQLV
jgi:ABC-type Na+ efflux pump permease subunit